jgi:hypothetical protein
MVLLFAVECVREMSHLSFSLCLALSLAYYVQPCTEADGITVSYRVSS